LPARGTRQHRIPTTPSKLFTRYSTLRFPEVDNACVYAFGMLPGFLENLLQSGNLFCSAMAATKFALSVIQHWFNYFRSIMACTLPGRLTKEMPQKLFHSPLSPLFVNGDDQSVFRCPPKTSFNLKHTNQRNHPAF